MPICLVQCSDQTITETWAMLYRTAIVSFRTAHLLCCRARSFVNRIIICSMRYCLTAENISRSRRYWLIQLITLNTQFTNQHRQCLIMRSTKLQFRKQIAIRSSGATCCHLKLHTSATHIRLLTHLAPVYSR